MAFLFTSVALNVAQVFRLVHFGNLGGIDSSSWMASTIPLVIFVFVLFGGLGLRLIGLTVVGF